jgi:hypothetical protein
MQAAVRYDSGLVFPDAQAPALTVLADIACDVLELCRRPVLGMGADPDGALRIACAGLRLHLRIDAPCPPAGGAPGSALCHVSLSADAGADLPALKPLLARILLALVQETAAAAVYWGRDTDRIGAAAFLSIMSGGTGRGQVPAPAAQTPGRTDAARCLPEVEQVRDTLDDSFCAAQTGHARVRPARPRPTGARTPRRVPGTGGGGSVQDHEMHLRQAFLIHPSREELADLRAEFGIPPELIRLASWLTGIALALVFLPIGVALLIYTLVRGTDFRVSTHALTLTCVFFGLDAAGSTAQAMAMLPL